MTGAESLEINTMNIHIRMCMSQRILQNLYHWANICSFVSEEMGHCGSLLHISTLCSANTHFFNQVFLKLWRVWSTVWLPRSICKLLNLLERSWTVVGTCNTTKIGLTFWRFYSPLSLREPCQHISPGVWPSWNHFFCPSKEYSIVFRQWQCNMST